jgi:very-short-patch-repair endonuclease
MGRLVVGSEALASGMLTRQMLRTRYVKLYHNVYAPVRLEIDAVVRAEAAWLWSGRKAILVGNSAAAILGTRWLPSDAPAELARVRHPAPPGIVIHSGRIAEDERCKTKGISGTIPARTAYDIGRRVMQHTAIVRIDALMNATGCTVADIERIASRYPGARGMRQLRSTLTLVDSGAESPQETRLRLLLVRSIRPRPTTQIEVGNRRIDMGWPRWKVGVEYDGEQHWTDPRRHADDIERLEFLAAQGWLIVRVSARQLRYDPRGIVRRVGHALEQAGWPIQYL